MIIPLLRFFFFSILSLSILQSSNAVEPSPIKPKAGGGGTATPAASPEKKPASAGAIDEKLFNGMQWRQVGPFRGGRALAIEGVPGEPDTWYFGGVAGGVWKTVDAGQNWTPLFDKQDISSIGAIAVAASD